ncbi:unnamed protein product [Protopolystoma xenopodis]|uniref:Uncharacterized protein n=1 Tax=Protopolystoma xenopodis TaxID=117903 RepID=A0A448WBL7_9PLAT|nr:unnamed protein product [Protopolystoma xenopodis]
MSRFLFPLHQAAPSQPPRFMLPYAVGGAPSQPGSHLTQLGQPSLPHKHMIAPMADYYAIQGTTVPAPGSLVSSVPNAIPSSSYGQPYIPAGYDPGIGEPTK